ncbi:hypothetical protein SAMN02745687_00613 [Lachnospiraceae bacterium NK3A20]|nr:hypothetical protein SAMN02745687_00613 [Lachnospiraceae bacterium NK3A20]
MKYISGFIKGFRRVFDAGGWLKSHRTFNDGFQKDYDSLRRDWIKVGSDIRHGMKKFQQSEEGKHCVIK